MIINIRTFCTSISILNVPCISVQSDPKYEDVCTSISNPNAPHISAQSNPKYEDVCTSISNLNVPHISVQIDAEYKDYTSLSNRNVSCILVQSGRYSNDAMVDIEQVRQLLRSPFNRECFGSEMPASYRSPRPNSASLCYQLAKGRTNFKPEHTIYHVPRR